MVSRKAIDSWGDTTRADFSIYSEPDSSLTAIEKVVDPEEWTLHPAIHTLSRNSHPMLRGLSHSTISKEEKTIPGTMRFPRTYSSANLQPPSPPPKFSTCTPPKQSNTSRTTKPNQILVAISPLVSIVFKFRYNKVRNL